MEWLIKEERPDGRTMGCWIERSAFQEMSVDAWWDWIDRAAPGWQQNDIRVFGQWHKEPRLTAWWGPAYRYASVVWPARPLDGDIARLTSHVTRMTKTTYDGVLVNGYRNGQDAMGWHRDNERHIDPSSIASLSLGASRTFKLRDRRTQQVIDINLEHGDLLVMEHLQDIHEHSVPRRMKVKEPRINFTFRRWV